jgi:DNA-binding transcriptional LysR family regulator
MMLRLLRSIVSIILLCMVAAPPATARTITIQPGESIRAAIEQASPGDRVQELPREIMFEPLREIEAFPAGRIGNPFLAAKTWAGLRGSRWVLNLSSGSQGQMFLTWLERQGVPLGGITRCASPHLMAEMMRRTDALGFCPRILLEDPYYGAGLQALRVRPLPSAMTLGLMMRDRAPMSAPAMKLAGLFRAHLRQRG